MVDTLTRRFFDADSHVLEPADWLTPHADPAIRDRLQPALVGSDFTNAKAAEIVAGRERDPGRQATARERLFGKGYEAYGAYDPMERSRVLDRFGIDRQLVFSTFAPRQYASEDLDVLYGGTRAHTRAMVEFCSADERLVPVAFVPLVDPQLAVAELDFALASGCGAVHVPSRSPRRDLAPSHPDLDPFWARLQDADVPFVLHIGGGGRLLPAGFRDNGRPVPPDFLGGGENIRSKDFVGIPFWPEWFLSIMALDGVLERFSRLRGASIEQGAEWVVTFLRRLRACMQFARTEPDLAALPLPADDYIRRQVKFTPFAKEDTAWIIDQVGVELVMFSTDYPHPEGTRDPIGRFDAALAGLDDAARQRFYVDNMAELLGETVTA
jgi:predicted TIM-barrel fold metal-dependent hydrolase